MTNDTSTFKKWRAYYEAHEGAFAIAFFLGGFLFDLKMVERIDAPATIGQQALYLGLILIALLQMFFEEDGQTKPIPPAEMSRARRLFYDYRAPAVHFFFGTLLNMYTIFFFKSSSLLVSFGFLALLLFLLVANESHRFKSMGVTLKFALLAVCLQAYAACLIPILVGHMGTLVFVTSLLVGSLPPVLCGWWIQLRRPKQFDRAKSQILLPTGGVLLSFLILYLLKLTPPVPLSIPFIGVYHKVEHVSEGYKLAHLRPWWKFWQHGDQDFRAQRADRVFVAFRIFSPTNFSDRVNVRWYWRDNQRGWTLQDTLPIQIIGGRSEGFRGFGVKSNYQPGDWRVQVETSDEREIGRIYFHLAIEPEGPREFDYDLM